MQKSNPDLACSRRTINSDKPPGRFVNKKVIRGRIVLRRNFLNELVCAAFCRRRGKRRERHSTRCCLFSAPATLQLEHVPNGQKICFERGLFVILISVVVALTA